MPQGAEEAVIEKVMAIATPAVAEVMKIPAVQTFLADYKSLDEKQKRDVDALFGVGSFPT